MKRDAEEYSYGVRNSNTVLNPSLVKIASVQCSFCNMQKQYHQSFPYG
jgi:hypothetical protein